MNSKYAQHMSLLGICTLVFYGTLAAAGQVNIDLLPQFFISALIFIVSGFALRRQGRGPRETEHKEVAGEEVTESEWTLFANLTNWLMAFVIFALLAVWIMKPAELGFIDALFYSGSFEHLSPLVAP